MRKLTTLLLAAGLLIGTSAATANAGDVKLFGMMKHQFKVENTLMKDIPWGEKTFNPLKFGSEILMGFQYIASENLSGTVVLRAGGGDAGDFYAEWGSGPKMFNVNDAFGHSRFYVREAYLDWTVPSTKISVRMGLQTWATPRWCNGPMAHAFETDPGVVVNIPINQALTATAAWFRGSSEFPAVVANGTAQGTAYYGYNGRDFFYLGLTFRGQGFIVQPWAMYDRESSHNYQNDQGVVGAVSQGAHTWNIGVGGQVTAFDPFVIEFNAAYGKQHNPGKTPWGNANSNGMPGTPMVFAYSPNQSGKGFGLKANVGYKTKFGVPTLDVWYYSGDKRGDDWRVGHMPHNGGSNNIALLRTTRSYLDGDGVGNPRVTGTKGIALSWKNLSFLPGLSHTAVVSYWRGNNNVRYNNQPRIDKTLMSGKYLFSNNRFAYMTTKDSYIEADLMTSYRIYPQLTFMLDLGYGWCNFKNYDAVTGKFVDAGLKNVWRIAGGFVYNF